MKQRKFTTSNAPPQSSEAIEAFKKLRPSYRLQNMKEMGLTEEESIKKQFEIEGELLKFCSLIFVKFYCLNFVNDDALPALPLHTLMNDDAFTATSYSFYFLN